MEVTVEYTQERNPSWPQIPDHPYRILIFGGSGLGKTYALLNLMGHEWFIIQILIILY